MKIVSLTAENVKKLKAVHIVPSDNVVMLTGKNGAGKSSVLDSIIYALGGNKELCEMPIRNGQESGRIELDLGDIKVVKTITEKGGYLSITNKAGFKAPSPQALLDQLVGKISFDPCAFINEKDAKKQRKVLLDLVGVNLDELDKKIASIKQDRTLINKERDILKFQAEQIVIAATVPTQEISIADLTAELQKANEHNAGIAKAKEEAREVWQKAKDGQTALEQKAVKIEQLNGQIEALQKQIEELTKQRDWQKDSSEVLRKDIAAINDDFNTRKAAIEAMVMADTIAIGNQIKQAEETNKLVRQAQKKAEIVKALAAKDAEYKAKAEAIEAVEAEKVALLQKSPMPIEGLSVSDTGVTYKGVPIGQISSGEKLRVGIAVSMALNPTLKVLRITDGSLLDSDNLAAISQMVHDKDYQVWIEKVDETGQVGIFIEDGEIKAVETAEKAETAAA
jgi:energy-coupling factor transporter ATP-binding protein EcfA2